MPYTKQKLLQIAVALAATLVIAGVFWTHSGRYDPSVMQGFDAPETTLESTRQEPLRIALLHDEQSIAGIALYAANDATSATTIRAHIEDEQGTVLARKLHQRTYYKQGGYAEIQIFFPQLHYPKKQEITLVLSPWKEPPLVFVATAKGALVYSLLYKEPVSDGAKQGIAIGTALATTLIFFYFLQVPKRWKWLGAALIICMFSILATVPYLDRSGNWGIYDWDYRYSLSHIYQSTIKEHNQFPLWNPYICGGTAGLGDPEFAVITPSFALQYLFGVEDGTGIALTLSFVIGGMGILLLAKSLLLDPFSSLIATLTVLFSTALMLKATEGHTTIIFAYMWVPWVFWAWQRAYRTLYHQWTLLSGVFLALAVLQGGIYIVSYTMVSLGALSLLAHKRWRAVQITLYAVAWMIGLSGFQLIPALFWVKEFPDQAFVGSAYTLSRIWDIFFGRYLHDSYVLSNQLSRWHEYGAYVGYGVFALVLVGISFVQSSRVVRFLTIGLLGTLFLSSLGPLFEPLLQSMSFLPRSNISRLVLYTLLSAGLLAGFGMKRLISIFPSHLHFIPVIVVSFISIDLLSITYPIAAQGFVVSPATEIEYPFRSPITHISDTFETRHQGNDIPRTYGAVLKGYGTASFCSVIGPKSAIEVAVNQDEPPAYLQSDARTSLLSWSPNAFIFSYTATSDTDIKVNSNYAQGWRTSHGAIDRTKNRLTIHVPAGKATATVQYIPPGMVLGLIITTLTLLLIVLVRKDLFQVR